MWLYVLLGAVALQRLAELMWSRRNTRRLLARGGHEEGAAHYPLIVAVHAGWLVAMAVTIPPDTAPDTALILVFLVLQACRLWVLFSLGDRWPTGIVILPGEPRLRRGPYRWLNHPNYLVVAAEIATLPLAFGAGTLALIFSILNALVLAIRIRKENQALSDA